MLRNWRLVGPIRKNCVGERWHAGGDGRGVAGVLPLSFCEVGEKGEMVLLGFASSRGRHAQIGHQRLLRFAVHPLTLQGPEWCS